MDADRAIRWPGVKLGLASEYLPFALILLWTCAVRLPFYGNVGDDEFFFAVIAQKWLAGGLPYVAAYDVKPPGLFAIYALAQTLFGESLATIKGMEILFTAAGGYALFRLARTFGTPAIAPWIAVFYPIYSLALSGVTAVNLILQLPFLILGFHSLLAANKDASRSGPFRKAFLSGLFLGIAGMLRQAIVFEVIAALALLLWSRPFAAIWRRAGLFALGATIPASGFAIYFAAQGHLHDAVNAVVFSALARSQGEILAAHGQAGALHMTAWDVFGGLFAMMPPVLVLAIASLLAWTRRAALQQRVPKSFLVVATVWLVAAAADVLSAHAMFPYYLLAALPPLLLLSTAFAAHGTASGPPGTNRFQILLAVAMVACPLILDHRGLFSSGLNGPEDKLAADRAITKLQALHPHPDDHVLVLNRGLQIYVGLHLTPPTAYFHPKHLLCEFPTASGNPLAEALAARPRFVVVADPSIYRLCEQPARLRMVEKTLKAQYRLAAQAQGSWDSFSIYQLTRTD
jgi:hypothetical protein